ncbi:MAG TPA: AAA family ATPase, partial [Candidatus Udaeobacter sp.]|nr:AAA family ATPase [Candidatus Udaeobacter sp.]
MTAAAVEVPKANVTPIKTPIVPMKVGMFGPQGAGKSTSAALLAAAISAQFYNRAPVYVVDPEAAWQFLNPVIFQAEGIELIQRPFRAFTDMQASIDDAERRGACVWVIDPLTLMWNELMQSFQQKNRGFIPIEKWGDIKAMWQDYIRRFLNSPMTCIACGRLGNEMEEVEDERKPGKTKLVKVGTKFKAGGGESFGYEPHLLLELSLERKAKKERGREI